MSNCEWVYGDAATGALGFAPLARLNPFRWSGPISFEEAREQLKEAVAKDGDRPVVIKVPAGVLTEEKRFESVARAIAFLNDSEVVATWTAQWALAQKTCAKFATVRNAAIAGAIESGSNEVKIDDEHFADLRAGHWFIVLNQHLDELDAVVNDGTDTSVNPKAHLRTVGFVLQGNADLTIVNKAVAFDGRKFTRARVTIPGSSFPTFGTSHFLVCKLDGHRLSPSIPICFSEYWKEKARGYSKYGPTFVQYLDSLSLSSHRLDKVTVNLGGGKKMMMPTSDKTRPILGGEKVVVRGITKLENLQRHKFVFPTQSTDKPDKLMFESVDGYLESIKSSQHELELTLLVQHHDDVHDSSFPFGPSHDPPENSHHHHNSYSRMFNVDPLTGMELIELAGTHGRVTLPAGTIMEHTLLGVGEVSAAAAIAAGCAEGAVAVGEVAAIAAGCEVAAEGGELADGETAVGAAGVGAQQATLTDCLTEEGDNI